MKNTKNSHDLKKTAKKGNKAVNKTYKLSKNPLMAGVFDIIEGARAIPNGRTPFNSEIKIESNVVYKTVGTTDISLDIYYPSGPSSNKSPAVLIIPGGGWMIHNRARRDGYARCFAVLGVVAAVIDHRLCPEIFFPDNLADCIDAYNFLVKNADKYGIDKNNITVAGDSSGGHLSACMGCAATHDNYANELNIPTPLTRPSGMIFISGAFSFDIMYRIPFTHMLIVRYVCGLRSRREFRQWRYYKHINPYNFINADFPVSYNNGGATDFLCLGEAKRMAEKLDDKGVENSYHVGKNIFNCMHCYALRLPYANARRDIIKLYAWYCERQRVLGVNLEDGFARLKKFMNNYKNALKGKVKC